MPLDLDRLLEKSKEHSNVRLANGNHTYIRAIETGEIKIVMLLALAALGGQGNTALDKSELNLTYDYADSNVTQGFESARLKVDEYINNVNKQI